MDMMALIFLEKWREEWLKVVRYEHYPFLQRIK